MKKSKKLEKKKPKEKEIIEVHKFIIEPQYVKNEEITILSKEKEEDEKLSKLSDTLIDKVLDKEETKRNWRRA